MLTKQHHIAIIVSDLDKALAFYADKLEFTVTRKVHRPERQDWLVMLEKGQLALELFVKPDAPARPSHPEAMGLRHLAFRVEDVEAAAGWLRDRGIETEPIRVDPIFGGKMTFFHDPDGLPLELHE